MELRLNKLISESGLCSRREADKFIEMGRVTVNGKQPQVGQKVTERDEVRVDGERISTGKYFQQTVVGTVAGKVKNQGTTKPSGSFKERISSRGEEKKSVFRKGNSMGHTANEDSPSMARPAKYGKYNKYAAARKAARTKAVGGSEGSSNEDTTFGKRNFSERDLSSEKEKLVKEVLRPQFGKSMSRSAIAQRLAASPKSASLRKTSRNNPINKAKRNNRNQSGNK